MPEKPELLPCPFCGSPCIAERWGGQWEVLCQNDKCRVVVSVTCAAEIEAIAAWNTRAPSELERLAREVLVLHFYGGDNIVSKMCDAMDRLAAFLAEPQKGKQ